MLRGTRGSSSRQQLSKQFEGLLFGRELLQDPDVTFRLASLETLGFDGEIACIAYDSIQSLLAVATRSGRIVVYPKHGVPKCSWSVRPAQPIKHLLFKTGTACLLAVDAKETLHIHDLSDVDERGEPARLFTHSMRARVNCIEYIPTLSHIFIGCADGTVDTFDVERLGVSPYRIPNLWMEQDELLRRSGVPNAPSNKRISACCDLKTHPLDPNQMLIAYEGGIALYNLSEQQVLRTYEYIVLPGAPGGHNDQTETAFLERRPGCMCLAWRPDAKLFAAGYDDGTIAFWSIEDGDKPVMARTLSMEDVNLATSSSLFADDPGASDSSSSGQIREPIFKMTWSAFSDNTTLFDRFSTPRPAEGTSSPAHKAPDGTILTVLGGLLPSDPKGLHTLHLPPYVAPSIISGSGTVQARDAFRTSVRPMYSNVLPTHTPPEDFLLFTPDPYYGHARDPYAVLLLTSPDRDLPKIAPHTERGFAAYPFPPVMGKELEELELPIDLHISGSQAVLHAEAYTITGLAHKRLVDDEAAKKRLPLTGGSGELHNRSSKVHPTHHAAVTAHVDMSVKIWDYTKHVPSLLDAFVVREALDDDQLLAYLDGQVFIEMMSSAWESTEMAFALSTGDVYMYKFAYAKPSAILEQQQREDQAHYNPRPEYSHYDPTSAQLDVEMAAAAHTMSLDSGAAKQKVSSSFFHRRKSKEKASEKASASPSSNHVFDVEVIDKAHLSNWTRDGYKPLFRLSASKLPQKDRRVTAISLSDAGFLAVAWLDRLCILDLRGPEVLYAEGKDRSEDGAIRSLTWTVCHAGEDMEKQPRLLVVYESGLLRVLILSFTLDMWIVETNMASVSHSSMARPLSAFVFDSYGNQIIMNGTSLDDYLQSQERGPSSGHQQRLEPGTLASLVVVVSESSIDILANITGERLTKRDFAGGKAVEAQVVTRYGMPVLAVVMQQGHCVLLSLPKLQEIRTLRLNFERARPSVSSQGRILQLLSPSYLHYSTIFAEQARPTVKASYHDTSKILPAAPVANYMAAAASTAAAYVSSWWRGDAAGMSDPSSGGLDDMLAGPNRPLPRIKAIPVAAPVTQQDASAGRKPVPRNFAGRYVGSAGQVPQGHEEVEYNRFGMPKKKNRNELTDALEERGEKLDFLNDNLDKASNASLEFVNQAKRFAAVQGAKAGMGAASGIGKGIGKMFG